MPIGRPFGPVLTLAGSATAALRMNVPDFEEQLVALRDYLMRFARLQFRTLAEVRAVHADAVLHHRLAVRLLVVERKGVLVDDETCRFP